MESAGENATVRKRRGYTSLPNSTISDSRVSIEARGLLLYLMSCSEGWKFNTAALCQVCACGREKMQRMKRELQDFGYLALTPRRGCAGRLTGWTWDVDPEPDRLPGKPACGGTILRESGLHKNINKEEPKEEEGPALSEPDLFQEESTEEQKDSIPHRESRDAARDAFARFWSAYPKCKRKTDKPICAAVFSNIVAGKAKGIPKTDPEAIIAGAEAYAASNPDPEYIKAPVGWLRGARWEQHQVAAPDTSEPPAALIWEAFQARNHYRDNKPWRGRHGTDDLQPHDCERLSIIVRVWVWWRTGSDPAKGAHRWAVNSATIVPRLADLLAYDPTKPPPETTGSAQERPPCPGQHEGARLRGRPCVKLSVASAVVQSSSMGSSCQ